MQRRPLRRQSEHGSLCLPPLHALVVLNLFLNPLTHLTGLSDLPSLTTLDLSMNALVDISELHGNDLGDLSGLSGRFVSLERLESARTLVTLLPLRFIQ